MGNNRFGVRLETFLMDDSSKPYDFVKDKTPEEQFRKEVAEMNTIYNTKTLEEFEHEIRERRKK